MEEGGGVNDGGTLLAVVASSGVSGNGVVGGGVASSGVSKSREGAGCQEKAEKVGK